MHDAALLQDLAVVMMVAGLVTVIFQRFKLPVVLGYILAGLLIGPHTPPAKLVTDEKSIHTLAELGVVFLMFSLGLEFSLRKLRKVGFTAAIAAALEILLMLGVGYEIGRAFGWETMDCVFLGAILSISSTTIIVKALGELGRTKERFAELIFGILIVEDILGILMLALLSGIATTRTLEGIKIVSAASNLAVFLAVALVLGLLAIPRLLAYVARFKSNEVLLVTVLGLCFGVSLLAVKLEYSVALGAFLIGAIIAEARELGRIEILTEPIRDMFSAVFFVAIGMLIDPKLILEHALPVAVITLAVIVGKVITCSFGSFVAGNDTRTSLRVGMGLAQIGEFSFLIAALGLTLNATSNFLYPIAVAVSGITTLLTPFLIKNSDRLVNWFDRAAPPKFVSYLTLYTRWITQWREGRHPSMTSRLMRRWAWQMALNLALVAGIFIAAAYLGQRRPDWLSYLPGGDEWINAFLWLSAIVLSLPLIVATYRKLQALGLLIAEMAGTRLKSEPRSAAIQTVIANTIPVAGAIGMSLHLLVLSATVLPSWRIVIALLFLVAVLTALLWRDLIRVYSKAQFALEETFAQPPPPRHHPPPPALAGLLKEAELVALTVVEGAPCKGRLIRELALRTETGASIVAIERAGANIVNPGPDEELLAGDQVLLLGKRAQLEAARRYLLEDSARRSD
jgi:CPA2 family monovalent cation:H+ antiporter-2